MTASSAHTASLAPLAHLQAAINRYLKEHNDDDRSEDAAPEALAGELGEEAFDGIEPGTGFWGEVEGPARVPGEPGSDLGVGVRGVVVDNGMDQLAGRDRALDGIEEADELLVPVSLHAAAEDDAIERVESGKQGGGAVPLIIMSHSTAPVVGLYMHPPAHAVVLSIDEKSQIQALDRTQPGLPIEPGPKPFIWTKPAEAVLAKLNRLPAPSV